MRASKARAITGAAVILGGVLITGACSTGGTDMSASSSSQSVTSSARQAPTVFQTNLPANLEDKRVLAGYAEDIFFGQVISQGEVKIVAGVPWTKFKVNVLRPLKGELKPGAVELFHQGGVDPQTGVEYRSESEAALEVNRGYLFATHGAREGLPIIVPLYGAVGISANDLDRVKDTSGAAELVPKQIAMEEALANAVPYRGG